MIISAKQAFSRTELAIEKEYEEELKIIEEAIVRASGNGKLFCFVPSEREVGVSWDLDFAPMSHKKKMPIDDALMEILEKKYGYSCERSDAEDGINIYWGADRDLRNFFSVKKERYEK
jgi:hypothetical protein